jgi:arabinofuranan 3-O-arabinosyltransferase
VRAATFGPLVAPRTEAKARLLREGDLSGGKVPALEVWTVPGGAARVAAYPAENVMLVSGGPEATVPLAAAGLLGPAQAAVLAADLADVGDDASPTSLASSAGSLAASSAGAGAVDAGTATDSGAVAAAGPAPDAPPVSTLLGPAAPWMVTDTFDRRDHQFGLVHNAVSYLLGEKEGAGRRGRPPA